MPEGYVVVPGRRRRDPRMPVRTVAADGAAFQVYRSSDLRPDERGLAPLSLCEAVAEALRRAGLDHDPAGGSDVPPSRGGESYPDASSGGPDAGERRVVSSAGTRPAIS